jgi:hypothetical protein
MTKSPSGHWKIGTGGFFQASCNLALLNPFGVLVDLDPGFIHVEALRASQTSFHLLFGLEAFGLLT